MSSEHTPFSTNEPSIATERETVPALSMSRVVSEMRLLLAARRAARNASLHSGVVIREDLAA
jgi:hypothetical protein